VFGFRLGGFDQPAPLHQCLSDLGL
jgi:hypothetical protein